jgi:hypothetical protein
MESRDTQKCHGTCEVAIIAALHRPHKQAGHMTAPDQCCTNIQGAVDALKGVFQL